MVDWYTFVLEAQASVEHPMGTFLTYDEEHLRVVIFNRPGLQGRPAKTAGVQHYSFTYATLDDLFATYRRLASASILPFWCVNHGTTLSMYYRDPDQNQVELQIDIFDSVEAVNAWFEQSDFDTNPVGVKFDPDELIARYRSGEDRASLLERDRIDPREVPDQLPPAPKPTE